jgi:hypothetical protein
MARFGSARRAVAALAMVLGASAAQAADGRVVINGKLQSGNTISTDTYEVRCPVPVSSVVINIIDTGIADPLLLSCTGTAPAVMRGTTRTVRVPALGVNNCQLIRPQKLGDGSIRMLAAVTSAGPLGNADYQLEVKCFSFSSPGETLTTVVKKLQNQ